MSGPVSRTWAAGYLHRALQLARDEALDDEQVAATMAALAWFSVSPDTRTACLEGATTAGTDVRSRPDGGREWVLIGATNYRTAGQLLTMQTSPAERAELMRAFQQVLAVRPATLTAASSLLDRIEQRWRTGVTWSPAATAPPEPVAGAENTASGPDVATHPAPQREGYSFELTPPGLPLPDPAWFHAIATAAPGRVEKGAAARAGTREARSQAIWAGIAEWLQQLTTAALGAGWTAKPHQWQNSGYFSRYYWGKVHPADHPLRDFFNVGVQIAPTPQWIDEFDPRVQHLAQQPVLALWVTTNDDLIRRVQASDPAFVSHALELYQREGMAAFETSPELWIEGGALVRWYRSTTRGKRTSQLMTARDFREAVQHGGPQGQAGVTSGLWSPLLSLEEAGADTGRATQLVFSYLRVFGEILASTYRQLHPLPH